MSHFWIGFWSCLAGMIIGGCIGVVIGGLMNSAKVSDLYSEIDELQKENSSLREYVDDLENENIK